MMDPHRARLNWGLIAKLDQDDQLNEVRAWLDAHGEADPGYQAALRWFTRRQIARERLERLRPRVQRRYAEFLGRPGAVNHEPDIWDILAAQRKSV